MNNSKIIAEVINELSKCENLLTSHTGSEPYVLAQALLKVSAQPDYNMNADILVIGAPDKLSDNGNEYGEASNKLIDVQYSDGAFTGHVVPTRSGELSIFDANFEPGGRTYSVEFGKAYQFIPGEGLKEI